MLSHYVTVAIALLTTHYPLSSPLWAAILVCQQRTQLILNHRCLPLAASSTAPSCQRHVEARLVLCHRLATLHFPCPSNTITVSAAAAAALGFAAYHYGGFPQLLAAVQGTARARLPRAPFKEEQLLRHVYARAAENNPQSVLDVMDDFGWKIPVDDGRRRPEGRHPPPGGGNRAPKVAVEAGAYCGYSAVLIGAQLPPDGHLYSVEIVPLHAAIATKVVEYAGLRDKVTVLVGTLDSRLSALRSVHGVRAIDLLFIDHDKRAYLSDLKRVEASGLLVKGSVVVADNVIYPGAPDYLGLRARPRGPHLPHHHARGQGGVRGRGQEHEDAVAVSVRLQ